VSTLQLYAIESKVSTLSFMPLSLKWVP